MLIGLGQLDFRIKANIQTKKSYSLSMGLIQPDYTMAIFSLFSVHELFKWNCSGKSSILI